MSELVLEFTGSGKYINQGLADQADGLLQVLTVRTQKGVGPFLETYGLGHRRHVPFPGRIDLIAAGDKHSVIRVH